jgi:hypothetical protein
MDLNRSQPYGFEQESTEETENIRHTALQLITQAGWCLKNVTRATPTRFWHVDPSDGFWGAFRLEIGTFLISSSPKTHRLKATLLKGSVP